MQIYFNEPFKPQNEGPAKDAEIFPPKLIKDTDELKHWLNLFQRKDFFGSIVPDKVSIGLNNIHHNEESGIYKLNISSSVLSPTTHQPKRTQSVNMFVELDNLNHPKYKAINVSPEHVDRFWDSILNSLNYFYPETKKLSENAHNELITDIQYRALSHLLDELIIPEIENHNQKRIRELNKLLTLPSNFSLDIVNNPTKQVSTEEPKRQLGLHKPINPELN